MSLTLESRPGAEAWPGDPGGPLVGRDVELSLLRGMVDPVPAASRVLVVLGDAGIGKSVLLADMAQRARSSGARVLAVTGREPESNLPFAALHQLLRPVVDSTVDLPARQSKALRGALGLTAEPVPPDRLLTGIAALTLLSEISERSPLLVIVDDTHLLDRSSLDVLSFVGRRLDTERVVLVLGGRGPAPPAGLDSGFPELRLEPLPASDANRLLDEQPHPPRGRARGQVLAQAAGNPLALIELAKVIAADPAAWRRWAAEPLPLSRKLAAVLAARFAGLPEPTRAALLLAAIADSPGPGAGSSAATGGTYGLVPDVLAPAERLGLVRVDRSGLQFSHPLVRSAIYHAAPFAERAAAHPGWLRHWPISPTGGRGTWLRRRCNRTNGWRRYSRPPPGRRSAAAVRRPRRWPWSVPPSSARTARTRRSGWYPPPRSPSPPGRRTGSKIWPAGPWPSRRTRSCRSLPAGRWAGRWPGPASMSPRCRC